VAQQLAASGVPFRVHADPLERITLLDTVDGLIQRRGARLWIRRVAYGFELALHESDRVRTVACDTKPAFASDLRSDAVGRRVRELAGVRRLFETIELRWSALGLDLEDEDHAGLRLRVMRGEACLVRERGDWTAMPDVLIVESKSKRDGRKFIDWIRARVSLEPVQWTRFDAAIAAVGDPFEKYRSKPPVPDRDESALRALRRILAHWVGVMQLNEEGVRADLDPEFLHDYRVAVRRSRSLLSQLKTVFNPVVIERFRADLAWTGKVTGACRDLDVFLLDLAQHEQELEDVRFTKLSAFLARKKTDEHRALVTALDSERHARFIEDWQRFLSAGRPETAGPLADQSLRAVMAQKIWKAYKKVVRLGARVDAASPAERLHAVRIACKKLRYLIDASKGLYSARQSRAALTALKGLQDVLGAFNDRHVQVERIYAWGAEFSRTDEASAADLIDLGRLTQHLLSEASELQHDFAGAFETFASKRNRRKMRSMLHD